MIFILILKSKKIYTNVACLVFYVYFCKVIENVVFAT